MACSAILAGPRPRMLNTTDFLEIFSLCVAVIMSLITCKLNQAGAWLQWGMSNTHPSITEWSGLHFSVFSTTQGKMMAKPSTQSALRLYIEFEIAMISEALPTHQQPTALHM